MKKKPALTQAKRLYKRFSGHDAVAVGKMTVKALPKIVVAIGFLDGVDYTTIRDGKTLAYRHTFRKKSRPLLAVTPDGKQLLILGGGFRFTSRGIVDR